MAAVNDGGGARARLLLVQSDVLARVALVAPLAQEGFAVVPVASAEEALEVLAADLAISALVTDVSLSSHGMNGFELVRSVHTKWHIPIVVMSDRLSPEQEQLPTDVQLLSKPIYGATLVSLLQGLLSYPKASLSVSNDSSAGGNEDVDEEALRLTPRQHEVLAHVASGKSNREIAPALGVSENTVKVHMAALFRSLDAHSRIQAVLAGRQYLSRDSISD